MKATRRVILTAFAAAAGWCVGWVVVLLAHGVLPNKADYPFLARHFEPPHHVPKYPDGVSFRFAMAHDVIHERFAKHGPAFYRERDRLVREKLKGLAPDSPEAFALADDLGVGLDRLGRSDEAVAVLREKLARQEAKGLSGRDLYTSYANLGTFLIHGSFKPAAAGDASARERFREGVAFIHKSIEVNPQAHFGRERWQETIAEFLLAAMDDPSLPERFDCIGDGLGHPVDQLIDREQTWWITGYGRPYDAEFSREEGGKVPPSVGPDLPESSRESLRGHITKVGAEEGWLNVVGPSQRVPAAFDEPALGIIGMWRQGGGANPHFALALGEIMLRVGQRFIAWTAFERASRLAERYSADPSAREFLKEYCRKRQADIEGSLGPGRAAGLREAFDAELAHGEGYQKAYQEFEAAKIAAGASIDDEHFFDDFPRRGEAIASKSGREEWATLVPKADLNAYISQRRTAGAALGAGLAAMAAALGFHAKDRRRARRPAATSPEADHPAGAIL